jgi:nucleotidyltransferase substrate binding protein (TIGR01987 family)
MSRRRVVDSISNLEKALANLESALANPKDRELVVEGTIHRYEIAIELTWKTLKRALEYEGISADTPRQTVREAFRVRWLHDEDVWLTMIDRRNTTSHEYLDDSIVEESYSHAKKAAPVLRAAFNFLRARYSKPEN